MNSSYLILNKFSYVILNCCKFQAIIGEAAVQKKARDRMPAAKTTTYRLGS